MHRNTKARLLAASIATLTTQLFKRGLRDSGLIDAETLAAYTAWCARPA